MKNIQIFKTKKEYEEFVRTAIFRDTRIPEYPLYRQLIQWVIDHKTPIFYQQSDISEYANFSLQFNFCLIRDTYESSVITSLYFLHEFMHLLFPYPQDVQNISEEIFRRTLTDAEYIASNETEICAYYRIPELRKHTFPNKIFWDMLSESGIGKPSVEHLYALRKLFIETDILDNHFLKEENMAIKNFFKQYRWKNPEWCRERFRVMRKQEKGIKDSQPALSYFGYERELMKYVSISDERRYRHTILENVRRMFELVGAEHPPQTFNECIERIGELEGKILFPKERQRAYV